MYRRTSRSVRGRGSASRHDSPRSWNSSGMPMELRHITSFLVLAEELHFGRSAARLHISQPSLSLQLQQLERRLGAQLVARTSHSVRLTPAGEAFRKEAGPLLGQLDRAVEAARQAGPGATGHLRIGFNFP